MSRPVDAALDAAMDEALGLARQAALQDEVPVGAVVLHEGQVIGRGHNQREGKNDPLSHAELEAIHEAAKALKSWRLEGCTMVVTLEPCPMCLAAMQQARVAHVVYGADDPKGGAISLGYRVHEDSRTHHRFNVEKRPRSECSSILSEFFKKKRIKA
jgi:tRNA(adenine34) deaminase